MKNLFKLVVIVCVAFSCTNSEDIQKAKDALQLEAQAANNLLRGTYIDNATKCLSCEFDGKNIIYSYEVNEDIISIEQLRIQKETMEKILHTYLKTNALVTETKKNLKKIKGKFIYHYIGDTSCSVMTLSFDASKL